MLLFEWREVKKIEISSGQISTLTPPFLFVTIQCGNPQKGIRLNMDKYGGTEGNMLYNCNQDVIDFLKHIKDEKPYFLFSEKTLRLITPAFGFSHPRSTKTTSESGSCDRRPTTITLGNWSCERSKLTSTAEKGSSHRRASMTTFIFIVFQSSCYEEFSGIPVD